MLFLATRRDPGRGQSLLLQHVQVAPADRPRKAAYLLVERLTTGVSVSDMTGLQSDIGMPSARYRNIESQGAQ
jgi:hypothetical protein